MTLRSRILLAVAALLLVPVFFVPIWSISLNAPQYPEGIGMHIWLDRITGHDTHDLQNINLLNHYIGMKPIVPEEIPELQWMPMLFGFLVASGLVAAAAGRRSLHIGWLAAFTVLAVAGLADFYLWGYDYGHDLSPDAPIKVPGASYQPPVIGTKDLLNIHAASWPYVGSLFIGLSMALGTAALWLDRRHEPRTEKPKPPMRPLLLMSILLLAGCADGPREIRYGAEACEHCRMTVAEAPYGSQLRTAKGRTYAFDSIECLAAFAARLDPAEIAGVWVPAFGESTEWIPAADAVYLRSPALRSPMGLNLSAHRDSPSARRLQADHGGELLTWAEVAEAVALAWR